MPMIKKSTATAEAPAKESGLEAAVDRLTKAAPAETAAVVKAAEAEGSKVYQSRSYASDDARGKTRCVTWNAAVMSPSLAGMKWKTTEDFLKHVKRIADAGVNYTFDEKIEGI